MSSKLASRTWSLRSSLRPALGSLLLLALWFCSLTFLDAVTFIGQPFANFGYTQGAFVNPVLFAPAREAANGVDLWDQVLEVDGATVTRGQDISARLAQHKAGDAVVFRVRDLDGDPRNVTVVLATFDVVDFFRWHTSQTVMALAILVIGLLVWWLRAGPRAQAFCVVCLLTALMLASGVDGTLFHRAPWLFHWTAPFVPAAGMAFAVTLSPRMSRWRGRRWVWGVPLALGAVVCVALGAVGDGPARLYAALGIGVYALLLLGALAFFVVMLDAWVRPDGPVERSRAGVILLTWPLALGIPAVNFLLGFTVRGYEISAAPNAAILLIPVGVAYGIFRSQLFDADLQLRRILAELLITGVFTSLYALALGAAYLTFPEAASSPAVAVAMAAMLLALAAPLRDRVKRRVDSVLEGRRYDPQEALAALATALTAELSLERALQRLAHTLSQTVRPRASNVVLWDDQDQPQVHVLGGGPPLPLVPRSTWMDASLVLPRATHTAAPADDADEAQDVREAPLPDGVQVVVPLRSSGRELGALVLGSTTRRLGYSSVDLVFLRALAGQVAPTLATARFFAEVDHLNRTLEQRVEHRTADLTRLNQELRELDGRKDELIRVISHDFRSPLAIIRSHVDTLLSDPHMDGPTRKDFLHVVERQARRLTSMAENLLNLARLKDRGLVCAPFQVAEFVRTTADALRPRLDAAGVTFSVEVPPLNVWVNADADRLGQALQNLLDNAAKFTPRGGQVVLSAGVDNNSITFSVTDTGVGIPLEDQPHVTQPFYQVKRAGAEREGSGLGLAIVQAVVTAHGSVLALQSSTQGTRWAFTLPSMTPPGDAPNVQRPV